ncbi:MAG TPA: zinc-binding dehydrogenase, partial [Blastocatellia bacterium]|nr:zinc-binding dehydrogenase [Blastocatellia bacterium]
VIGKHAAKLELAAAAGVSTRTIDPADSLDTQIEVITGSRDAGFDIVVEASGSSSGLSLGLRLVKPRGTVVLKSTHQGPSEIVMSQVVVNELTIVGSRCGRFARAISLLDGGSIDVLGLVTASIPMDDWPRAFSLAADHSSLKVVLSVA